MKNKLSIIISLGFLILLLTSCDGMDSTYKDLQGDAPIVYLGKPDKEKIVMQPGRNRIKVSWPAFYDPRIKYTKITWANGTKEKNVPIVFNQPTEVMLDDMDEASYDFVLYNFNDDGLKSVTISAIGDVYGNTYESYLKNRNIESISLDDESGDITIKFPVLGDSTIVGTEFRWLEGGTTKTIYVDNPEDGEVVLENYSGTNLEYRCKFLPVPNAIDYFYAPWAGGLTIVKTVGGDIKRDRWTVTTQTHNGYGYMWDGGTQANPVTGLPEHMFDGNTGSYLSMVKPGGSINGVVPPADSTPPSFIVDMKTPQEFEYIKWSHRNGAYSNANGSVVANNYNYLRVYGITIEGSNDGTSFTIIPPASPAGTNASIVWIPEKASYVGSVQSTEDLPYKIPVTQSTYQYVKVSLVVQSKNYAVGQYQHPSYPGAGASGSGNTMQVAEFGLGLGEPQQVEVPL